MSPCSKKLGQPSPESRSTCSRSSGLSFKVNPSNATLDRLRVHTGSFQLFLHEQEGVSGGVIRESPEDLVAVPLVERPRQEAERAQEGALATLHPYLLFGGEEGTRPVSLAAERLRHPKKRELEPASQTSPKVPPSTAPVSQNDCQGAVAGVPGDRDVVAGDRLPDEGHLLRADVEFG